MLSLAGVIVSGMKRMSNSELDKLLRTAKNQVVVGGIYKHYKGKTYKVLAVALSEADLEPVVVYQAQYGNQLTFTRPVTAWLETVSWNSEEILRFRLVEK